MIRLRGFTLIEILVALLVVALGVLGLAGLQVRAQQNALEAQQRAQALLLLHDMGERIRTAERDLAPCYAHAVGDNTLGVSNSTAFVCDDSFWGGPEREQVTENLAEWDALLQGAAAMTAEDAAAGAMVGARGCISYNAATGEYAVSIAWQGFAPTAAPTGNSCGANAYGDERLRRVVTHRFLIANLN